MPRAVTISIRGGRRPLRLWVPVLAVLVLLSPFVALASLVLAAAGPAIRSRGGPAPGAPRLAGPPAGAVVHYPGPGSMLAAFWRLMWSLPGTRIEIERGRSVVLIHVT
jgi:hypothetical protein